MVGGVGDLWSTPSRSLEEPTLRALVTGASGFIGGHVVEALLAAGHEVVALVRSTSDTALLERLGVELAIGDVTDAESLRRACRGVDCVIHTAAVVSMYGAWEEYRRVGVVGTENMIAAAMDAGVRRFVHLGSIAVYGFRHQKGVVLGEDMPYDEDPEPWNHYVREKMLSEKVVWRAHETGRIGVTSLRPSVVIGPRDRNVVTRMMNLLRLPLNGTIGLGSNQVGCVVVGELAEAAVRAGTLEGAVGRAYNVSGREPITQREIYTHFAKAAGKRLQPFFTPYRVAFAGASIAERLSQLAGRKEEPMLSLISVPIFGQDFSVDSSRAKKEIGWTGAADYEAAIHESVKWHLANEKPRG
jgi:nucleoside-diphosphate-sugar epimerase